MTGINLYVLLLASLSFSVALGNHNYFEQYFSKYHHYKSSSTTTKGLTSSSVTEISPSEAIIGSIPDEITSADNSSLEDDDETDFIASTMRSDGDKINIQASSTMESGGVMYISVTVVGSIIFIVLVCCCFVSCLKNCHGAERRGYVVGTSAPPPQPVIAPAIHQPSTMQHLPPEFTQEPVQQFPPQYQQPVFPPAQYGPMQHPGYQYSPAQQQHQYSPVQPQTHYSPVHPGYQNPSTIQFYNPPEAPPPYEEKAPLQ